MMSRAKDEAIERFKGLIEIQSIIDNADGNFNLDIYSDDGKFKFTIINHDSMRDEILKKFDYTKSYDDLLEDIYRQLIQRLTNKQDLNNIESFEDFEALIEKIDGYKDVLERWRNLVPGDEPGDIIESRKLYVYLLNDLYKKTLGSAVIFSQEDGNKAELYNLIINLKNTDLSKNGINLSVFLDTFDSTVYGDNLQNLVNDFIYFTINKGIDFGGLLGYFNQLNDIKKYDDNDLFKYDLTGLIQRYHNGDIPPGLNSGRSPPGKFSLKEGSPSKTIIEDRIEYCHNLELKYLKKHLELYKLLDIVNDILKYIENLFFFFNITSKIIKFTKTNDIGINFEKMIRTLILSNNPEIEMSGNIAYCKNMEKVNRIN